MKAIPTEAYMKYMKIWIKRWHACIFSKIREYVCLIFFCQSGSNLIWWYINWYHSYTIIISSNVNIFSECELEQIIDLFHHFLVETSHISELVCICMYVHTIYTICENSKSFLMPELSIVNSYQQRRGFER